MEEQEEKIPRSLIRETITTWNTVLRSPAATLDFLVTCLDMTRRDAIQSGYKERKGDVPNTLSNVFFAEARCPFAQAIPEAMGFGAWLEWSGLRAPTKHREGVRFPGRVISMMLYYASYVHAVSVMSRVHHVSPDEYHRAVPVTLEALKAKKDRTLKLHIVLSKEGDRKHQLFHALFGKKTREPVPFAQRVWVPAQFFMHTWKSVDIDNSAFRLWSALPELYWIHVLQMGEKHPLVRFKLTNNVDVTNAHLMDVITLEDIDVECAVISGRDRDMEAARERTHADAYVRDFLGVSNGVKKGQGGGASILSKLERLRLKNLLHLVFLPNSSSSNLPVLDVVQFEGLDWDPKSFVRGLNERTSKIRTGRTGPMISIGPPRHLSIINCAIIPDDPDDAFPSSDIGNWIEVTPRTEVLELQGAHVSGVPAVRGGGGGVVKLKRLALFGTDGLHFEGTIRLCNPQELVLQDLIADEIDDDAIADVLREIKLTSASFVNTGITDFSRLLRGQALLERLTISYSEQGQGEARYSIPYDDLVSLREQFGFLADDNRMVRFTPGTAAKFRARTSALEVREITETAAQLGMTGEARDNEINSELDRQALSRLPMPFRWVEPAQLDNVVLPPWIPLSYYTGLNAEHQRELLHNWALWAAEMDAWVCGVDPLEGFFFGCNRIDDLQDVVREDFTDEVTGNKAIQFEWRVPPFERGRGNFLDESASIEREALTELMKKGVIPLSLRLVRRPRRLTGATHDVPGLDIGVFLDTESSSGHMFLEVGQLRMPSEGRVQGDVYVMDSVLGLRFMLCTFDATADVGADFLFPLHSLVTLLSTCAVVDMLMAAHAFARQQQEDKSESPIFMELIRDFENTDWRSGFPGLTKIQIVTQEGRNTLRAAAVERVGVRPQENRQTAWEHDNRQRLQVMFDAFSRMTDTVTRHHFDPVAANEDPAHRLLVRLNPLRAEISDCMSLVCLMGMGIGNTESSPLNTGFLMGQFGAQVTKLTQGVIGKMMVWLTVGRPVHSEHVLHGEIDGEDDDADGPSVSETGAEEEEAMLFVPTSQQSVGDRIASLLDRFFVFHQATDDEGDTDGLLWLFQQENFAVLYDVLIGMHPNFVAWKDEQNSDPALYDDRFRLAQFEWDLADLRSECTRLAGEARPGSAQTIVCSKIQELIASVEKLLKTWKTPMVEVLKEVTDTGDTPASEEDPQWGVIKVEYEKRIPLRETTGISKHVYALIESMQDPGDELEALLEARSLEEQAVLASNKQPSPHKSIPEVESPVKNQRLMSPDRRLSELPPPPLTVFQSPEQAAQKPMKKKAKMVIDEEEEEQIVLHGEEEGEEREQKTQVQVIVTTTTTGRKRHPQERIVISLFTPETSPEKPAQYGVIPMQLEEEEEQQHAHAFTPPRRKEKDDVSTNEDAPPAAATTPVTKPPPPKPVIKKKKKEKESRVVIDLTNASIVTPPGANVCAHCGITSNYTMVRCGRCKSEHYCNNGQCHIQAWHAGHKNNCAPTL